MNTITIVIVVIVLFYIASLVALYFITMEKKRLDQEKEKQITEAAPVPGPIAPIEVSVPVPVAVKPTRYELMEGGSGQNSLVCPEGSFVTEVYGGNTEFVDILGAKCSNGIDLGTFGGNINRTPTLYSLKSEVGFTKVQASLAPSNEYGIRGFSLFNKEKQILDNPEEPTRIIGFSPGQTPFTSDCGDIGKLVGFKLRSGDAIDNLSIVCEKA